MHRSGTSALTGTLAILGCTLPDVLIPGNPTNEKGHFESVKIRDLLDRILETNASGWDDWLPVSQGWFDSATADDFKTEAVDLLREEYGPSKLFVLKNPRFCRLLPFWDDVWAQAKIDPVFVLIHRNPLEVAASLQKRNGIDPQLGMFIWLRHTLEAEAGTRGRARAITSYAQLLQNWQTTARKLQSDLKVTFPRFSLGVTQEVESFLTPTLRHHEDDTLNSPRVPDWVRDVYDILERWTHKGECAQDYPKLDSIRQMFDAAAPSFARIVQHGRDMLTDRTNIEKDLTEQTRQKTDLQNSLSRIEAELERFKADHDALQLEMEKARSKADTVQKVAQDNETKLNAEISDLKAKADHAERSARQSFSEAEESQKRNEVLRKQVKELENQIGDLFKDMTALRKKNSVEQKLRFDEITVLTKQVMTHEMMLNIQRQDLENQRAERDAAVDEKNLRIECLLVLRSGN
jgi:hypothetical protein